jgi:hypothetical protein
MANWYRYPLQALNYLIFAILVGYLSTSPSYQHIEQGQAQVTLAFGHAGQPREPCRQLTPEDLAKLPPNMRRPVDCPRQRSPILVELLMDNAPLLRAEIRAPGLFEDGIVDVFRSVRVPEGSHFFQVRMNDNVRATGYTHSAEREITLEAGKLLVVDFNPERGFSFK